MVETTGGMSTLDGRYILVTSGGKEVGTSSIAPPRGGGGGVIYQSVQQPKSVPAQPTPREVEAQMSIALPKPRQATTKEQFFQQSFASSSDRGTSPQEKVFYGNIVQQQKEFMTNPKASGYGFGQTLASGQEEYFFYPDTRRAGEAAGIIDSRTGKPFGVLTPALTTGERYKSVVKDKGYVFGSLDFAGGLVGQFVGTQAAKKGGQARAEAKLFGGAVEYAPLFIGGGVGAGLLLVGSGEQLTPSRVSSRAESFQSSGIPVLSSGVGSYTASVGLPVAGVVAGGLGLRSAYLSSEQKLLSRLAKDSPTINVFERVELGGGFGYDTVRTIQVLQPKGIKFPFGGKVTPTVSEGLFLLPYKTVTTASGTDSLLFKGKGLVFTGKAGSTSKSFSFYDVTGHAGDLSALSKGFVGGTPLGDGVSFIGSQAVITRTGTGVVSSRAGINLLGKQVTKQYGSFRLVNEPSRSSTVALAGRSDDVIFSLGGRVKGIDYTSTDVGSQLRVTGGSNVLSIGKVQGAGAVDSLGSGGVLRTTKTSQFPSLSIDTSPAVITKGSSSLSVIPKTSKGITGNAVITSPRTVSTNDYSTRSSLGLTTSSQVVTVTSPRQTAKLFGGSLLRLGTSEVFSPTQRTNSFSAVIPRTTTKTSSITRTTSRTTSSLGLTTTPLLSVPRTPFIPFLPAPSIMGLASGRRYSRSLTGSFLSSYTPSLTSTTFGLFGKPSKTALTTGVVTPFERRYIVRRKKVRPVRQASNTILRKRRKRRWNWY